MKRKILAYYAILIVIAITVTGFFTSHIVQNIYKSEIEHKILTYGKMISQHISTMVSCDDTPDYSKLASLYSGIINDSASDLKNPINARITFICFKGNVLGESQADPSHMENHVDREEVNAAISGQIGKTIRYSETLGVDLLYIAVPIAESEVLVRVAVPLTYLNTIDKFLIIYTCLGVFAGLVITMLLAVKFTSSVIAPINKLIEVSGDIAKGNYSKRVEVKKSDEMGMLADTFNVMADKLEKTVNDLTHKNARVNLILNSMSEGIIAVDNKKRIILTNTATLNMFNISESDAIYGTNIIEVIRNTQINKILQKTITQNSPQTEEIYIGVPKDKYFTITTNPILSGTPPFHIPGVIMTIQDTTSIRKLEKIRTEFVSNVTHELKTPLTSIRGFVETLRAGAIEDPEVAYQFLDIIDIEADRLFTLISDILQLSEIETMQKDINISKYNLKDLFIDILPVLEKAAEDKNIKIIDEVDQDIKINVNQSRIKQLLMNLIDNAIKYNVENGNVWVKAYRREGMVVIKVKDNGIGIPLEHHDRIFERFYRVDKGRSRNMGGTGLGLSIIKHIVNLYNGNIRLISKPDQGTEFVVKFPL